MRLFACGAHKVPATNKRQIRYHDEATLSSSSSSGSHYMERRPLSYPAAGSEGCWRGSDAAPSFGSEVSSQHDRPTAATTSRKESHRRGTPFKSEPHTLTEVICTHEPPYDPHEARRLTEELERYKMQNEDHRLPALAAPGSGQVPDAFAAPKTPRTTPQRNPLVATTPYPSYAPSTFSSRASTATAASRGRSADNAPPSGERIHEAQSFLAEMFTPGGHPATRGSSSRKKRRSRAPSSGASDDGSESRSESRFNTPRKQLLQPLNGSMPRFPAAEMSPRSESSRSMTTTTASRKQNSSCGRASGSIDGTKRKEEQARPTTQEKTSTDAEFCQLLQKALEKPYKKLPPFKPLNKPAQQKADTQMTGSKPSTADPHLGSSRPDPLAASSTDAPLSSRISAPQEPLARTQPERLGHDDVSAALRGSSRRRRHQPTLELCGGIVQLNLCGASGSRSGHSARKHKKPRDASKVSASALSSAQPTPRPTPRATLREH